MEFADFDDDLFVEKPENKKSPSEYNARVCEDGWFLDIAPSNIVSAEDELGVLKFSSEYYFMKKNYNAARRKFEETLDILPESNSTTRRECFEGLSRCCLKSNDTSGAVQYAKQLHSTSRNSEQHSVSFTMLIDAYLCSKRNREALHAAQSLTTLHPDNSQVWTKLGFTYACVYNVAVPNVSKLVCAHLPINSENSEGTCAVNLKDTNPSLLHTGSLIDESDAVQRSIQIKDEQHINDVTERGVWLVCACLQRAYTLLKKTEGTAVGFAVSYSHLYQKHLMDDLQKLLDGNSLSKLQEAVHSNDKYCNTSTNSTPDNGDEFIDRGSSKFKNDDKIVDVRSIGLSESSFEEKWFTWL
ncbi:hypothetical protein Pmani_022159 [Petrolisthes manimaculis]|uniref:Uncharacterized protein n=1 Tax=Petrolisthes manimaculis TaxID=1843537 RepID=A0AAE1PF10_9EUCA|nr:hypothetical protein Pmani_022159 [Petrolisthes manimaculis]